MALYRGCTKVSGIGQSFNPENTGTEGQVLTKTNSGYAYCDVPEELPTTGNVGDVLTKTADGVAFSAPQGGGSKMVDVLLMGGGGGGGGGQGSNTINNGGGGGAGELKIVNGFGVNSDEVCVTIGAGGAGGACYNCYGDIGGNGCPTKFGALSAMGGGGGGGAAQNNTYASCSIGQDGASGGGAGNYRQFGACMGKPLAGGGYGAGRSCSSSGLGGGGGGGIGGDAGFEGYPFCTNGCCVYFYGGPGKRLCFGGTLRCIGGGGNGGNALNAFAYTPANFVCGQLYYINCQTGTCFGGGCGGTTSPMDGCNGTANTGGGGGGGGSSTAGGGKGGNGGSGLVIVRYPTDGSYGITSSTGGNTCRTCTINGVEYCIHEFTSDGTFCITG